MALLAQAKAERLERAKEEQERADAATDSGNSAPPKLSIHAPWRSGAAASSLSGIASETPTSGTEHELGWQASPTASSHRVARYEIETPKPGAHGRR